MCFAVHVQFNGNVNTRAAVANSATALLFAVYQRNHDMVEFLAGAGADLSIGDRDGDTPLHLAVFRFPGEEEEEEEEEKEEEQESDNKAASVSIGHLTIINPVWGNW